jgi:predicted nucleic acid-binding protein
LGLSRIFWDTNLFIYLLEGAAPHAARVRALLERMSERRDQLLTSMLTLGEVLVKPLALGNLELAERYERLLGGPGVSMLAFDPPAARIYAQLRRDKALKASDAIQLACAASARCDLFITSDDRLSRQIVPGIHFIAPLERAII